MAASSGAAGGATTATATSSATTLLEAFARSVLTIPGLLAPGPGGRLTAPQLAPFVSSADFPLWDLLAALNRSLAGTAPAEVAEKASARPTALSTEQTVALLANIVELARGRLVTTTNGSKTIPTTATTTATPALENGKQLVAYLEVLRRLLGQLPRDVLHQGELPGITDKGKGKQVETIVIDDDDDEEDDGDSDEGESSGIDEGGGSRSVRRSTRDQDGDDSMISDLEAAATPPSGMARPPRVPVALDPRVRTGLAYLWSREHLLALLALSTRYSASTRPALCGFLVELLVPSHASRAVGASTATSASASASSSSSSSTSTTTTTPVRDSILNTLLYSPLSSGLLRELFRGYIRSSQLGRTLASATKREKSAVVLAALKDIRYRDEWPVLVLAVEMYARSLLTMGDDEFYASTAAGGGGGGGVANGRNPLSLDEVVTLSSMIRNATFALYWQDESGGGGDDDAMMVDPVARQQQQQTATTTTTTRQTVAGMEGWSVEDVRGVMTRFLQQVHARE